MKDIKNIILSSYKRIISVIVILVLILILLAASLYQIKLYDGAFREEDWTSTPYVASTYTDSAKISENGIETDKTAEKIWDEMIDKGNDIEKYLDSPDELKKLMDAEIITQFPKTGNGDMDGIIEFERNTDGRKNKLTYIDKGTFDSYISSNNTDIVKYFTLDDSGNALVGVIDSESEEVTTNDSEIVISDYTETLSENNKVSDGKYSRSEQVASSVSINYKNFVSKYTMPFQYLWALLIVGEDKDFVLELADLVADSEITISLYDNITTTTTKDKYTYNKENKTETYAEVKAVNNFGITDYPKTFPIDVVDEETESTDYNVVHTTIYKSNNFVYDLTKANVWMIDYSKEYTCSDDEDPTTENEEIQIEDTDYVEKPNSPENSNDNPNLLQNSHALELANSAKRYIQTRLEQQGDTENINNVVVNVDYVRCRYYSRVINKKENISETTSLNGYTSGNVESNPKIENNADEVNFITILNKREHKSAKKKLANEITSWLIEILESNPDTINMIDLTKYLINKATGKSVEEFDFSEYEPDAFNDYATVVGDYVVKTDESNSAPVITEKIKLEKGLKLWLKNSSSQKQNALSVIDTVIDCQEEYNVNAVFIYAFLRNETGIGTANTNWVNRDNNWGSWNLGHKFSSPQENIETIARGISTGSIYFTQGRITVSAIGEKYCPNTADYPTQCEGWIEAVQKYMKGLYSAMGVETSTSYGPDANGGAGTIGTYTSTNGRRFNLYLQGSGAPWANEDYGNSHSMAQAGCGPTAAAIIASGYNGNITPSTVRAQVVQLFGLGNHSNAGWMERAINIILPEVSTSITNSFNETKIKQCLKSGGQVWLVVGNCKYTSGAHCISLIDYKESGNKVYVAHGTARSMPYGWEALSYIKRYYKNDGVLYVGGN